MIGFTRGRDARIEELTAQRDAWQERAGVGDKVSDRLVRDVGHFHELALERGIPIDVEPQGIVNALRFQLRNGDKATDLERVAAPLDLEAEAEKLREEITNAIDLLAAHGYGVIDPDDRFELGTGEAEVPLAIDPGRASLFFDFAGDNPGTRHSLPAGSIASLYTFGSDTAITTSVSWRASQGYSDNATSTETAAALTARLNALLSGRP